MDHLHDTAGQQAEVCPGRAHLGPVGHEDGRGEVPDHPGAEVDEGEAGSADQLLQVAHQPVLEHQGDGQVEQSGIEIWLKIKI